MQNSAATLAGLLDQVVDGAEMRPDAETSAAILQAAAQLVETRLAPLTPVADAQCCRLLAAAGLTAPQQAGEHAMTMALATAAQELFGGAGPARGMLAINARCATRPLQQHGDAAVGATSLLASGDWGAAICISEPQTGSDVERIPTRATESNGIWRVSGNKYWLSYGDHDLIERIGQFALAPRRAPAGTRGLSLFLIAETLITFSDWLKAHVAQHDSALLGIRGRAEAARLLALQTAAWVDRGEAGDGAAAARAGMLLPAVKTCNAEAAFANANDSIEVLGGAGYVSDWPVERLPRDSRVFSIYEGTTAIQGVDLFLRRVLTEGGGRHIARLPVAQTSTDPIAAGYGCRTRRCASQDEEKCARPDPADVRDCRRRRLDAPCREGRWATCAALRGAGRIPRSRRDRTRGAARKQVPSRADADAEYDTEFQHR